MLLLLKVLLLWVVWGVYVPETEFFSVPPVPVSRMGFSSSAGEACKSRQIWLVLIIREVVYILLVTILEVILLEFVVRNV